MEILQTENLEYFYEVDKKRQEEALKKISNYNFARNYNTIRKLLEKPDLDDAIFKLFIDKKNNLFISISLVQNFVIKKYYINAFSVYSGLYLTAVFVKDRELTKKWRKIMKETYPEPKYVEDAKKILKQELNEKQNKLIEDFNQENIDLF